MKEWEKMMKELYGVFIPKVVNYTQPIFAVTKRRANNTFAECRKAVHLEFRNSLQSKMDRFPLRFTPDLGIPALSRILQKQQKTYH